MSGKAPPRALAALVALAWLAASPAAAAAPPRAFTKLDPGVLRAVRTGLVGPERRAPRRPGRAMVLVELDRTAGAAEIAEVERAGARVARVEGKPLAYGRLVVADVDEPAAHALAADALVVHVANASTRGPLPLDRSAEHLRLADARGARPALDLMTGQGVVIGDVDSNVDVFHPTLFRGDAGYYDWIDVDGDGVLTPGVDAIDLNRNGRPDPGETATPLLAQTVAYGGAPVAARSAAWDPSTDWLYLDTNGNGARDYGPPQFGDGDPAFGEPLFVPDDVNRNGRVDAGERLVRLGSSKLREVYVHLELDAHVDHVYRRGKDLASLPVDVTHGALYGYADALHATGVATILAGDVPLVGRRWVGMAPDAELVLAWDVESTGEGLPLKATTWALQQKPDVMLYELAPWTGGPLDGSDPLSKLVDAANEAAHVTSTCPTGDQGSARKHAHADVDASQSVTLPFDVPDAPKEGAGPLDEVEVTLHVRGGEAASFRIAAPDGTQFDPVQSPEGAFANGSQWYATVQITERGTQMLDVIVYAPTPGGAAPPVGAWAATVQNGPDAVTVDAYVADDKSSWAVGAAWDASVATDTSTIGIPSVADHCIAVGAHPDHGAAPGEPWYALDYGAYAVPPGFHETEAEVRAYSPRGPRIDLVQKPDVLAPDNPWVATATVPGDASGNPDGSFWVFGGTSGASPHVTGVAALLAEAGVRGDAARDAIRAGAAHDATTGDVWNQDYGFGRLDAAGAFGVKASESGPPVVTLRASSETPVVGADVVLTPTAKAADGTTDGLQAKWDDAYDGTWNTDYAPVAPRHVTSNHAGD
ncbi:MAG TPA: S8 family serine peptidase, partial [Minicystis sp.]|nr:S8 family serine peptidase [Minicystis sp.]